HPLIARRYRPRVRDERDANELSGPQTILETASTHRAGTWSWHTPSRLSKILRKWGDVYDLRHCAFPRFIALISMHRRHGRCNYLQNLGPLWGPYFFHERLAPIRLRPQQVRHPSKVHSYPSGLIFAERLGRCLSLWLFFVIEVAERQPISVAHDEAVVEFFNCPW